MYEAIFNLLRKISTKLKSVYYSSHFNHGPRERLIIGKRVSSANTLFNTRSGKIIVEDGVMFAHNIMILTGVHDCTIRGSTERRVALEDAGRDIIVKKEVFIGSGAIILGPVTIGQDAFIGAGSVVTKDIPADVFAAGNPARVIKKIKFK